jgi:hypothetical protein
MKHENNQVTEIFVHCNKEVMMLNRNNCFLLNVSIFSICTIVPMGASFYNKKVGVIELINC